MKSNILHQAIAKYGRPHQIEKIKEECLELALEIQHMNDLEKNPECSEDKVIMEIADVKIMLAQADIMFDKKKVTDAVAYKLNRLKERLKT